MKTNLDMDVLRTFATGMELGSFARAAERLGRSPSAVSAQLRKLEELAATPVLRKSGRGLALTEAGETLLAYAHRLLDLNDEAVAALGQQNLDGGVRLGMQEDFGETVLPAVLGRFGRAHAKVRIEARIARNGELLDAVSSGRLDLALAWFTGPASGHVRVLAELPMIWVGPSEPETTLASDPLPLASLEPPCVLRSAATDALDRSGRSWRPAFVSPSLAGFWAAVSAGLGVGVRTPAGLPATVRRLSPEEHGLPPLPSLKLAHYRSEETPTPLVARLAAMIEEAVEDSIDRQPVTDPASSPRAKSLQPAAA